MPKWYGISNVKSQAGVQDSISTTYARGNSDCSFVTGQRLMFRVPTNIPRGATITSAYLVMNIYSNKDANGSVSHTIQAEKVGDSDRLVEGRDEWGRALTTASVAWNNTWTSGAGEAETRNSPSIVAVIQEVVSRTDWRPGASITLVLSCTAESGDMRARLNNDFLQRPTLILEWSLTNANDVRRTQVNVIENPNYDPALDSTPYDPTNTISTLGAWSQNPFFGSDVEAANMGTITRASSGERPPRTPGRNVLKFTTGTPPDPNTKGTGVHTSISVEASDPYIYCGWVYIPSATTEAVRCNIPFLGRGYVIPERDQWVPFCTLPIIPESPGQVGRSFQIRIDPPFNAGRVFYLTEPQAYQTDLRLMPFKDIQPDMHPVTQRGYREWIPRTMVKDGGGVPRPRSRWTKHSSGFLVLSEHVKGSVPITSLTGTISSLPGNIGDL